MHKKRFYFFSIIFISFMFSSCSLADNERKMVREGNKAYQDSIFDEAEVLYRKALDYAPTSFAANYNIANTTYKQENYKSAAAKYKRLLDSLETKEWKASANHNLGNSYLHAKKVDKAIAAYKEALRNNPGDKETKYNLLYAMNLKNKQQQNKQKKQEKQQQKQDQKSEQNAEPKDGDKEQKPQPTPKEDEDKQEKDNKEEKNQQKGTSKNDGEQEKGKEDKKQNEENAKQDDTNNKQPDEAGEERKVPVGISKKDAENILDAIAVEEKDTQEKVQKEKARKKGRVRKQKNW